VAKAKSGSSKIEPVGQGIREGVIGGSPKNTKGGAGGKALTAEEGTLMERYFSLLKARLKENHEKPSGLSDALMARVEFYVGADGSISRVRISKSSGSEEFDRSVREAFARTKSIGARPDKKGETVELEFRMREEDGG
jgi:colicin import membrane protein